MPRKGLFIGIDKYEKLSCTSGCVQDAIEFAKILNTHEDGTNNFDVEVLLDSDVTKNSLLNKLQDYFRQRCEVVLFYFAGHGSNSAMGGEIHTQESTGENSGILMNAILNIVNDSPAIHKIIILDCCHGGGIGMVSNWMNGVVLNDGVLIMTASQFNEVAIGFPEGGLFTHLIIDALKGGASDILGNISPLALYNYIDVSLPWNVQRPILKANINTAMSLRSVQPAINLHELMKITELFDAPDYCKQLDPEFEPDASTPIEGHISDPKKVADYRILQKYNRVNIVVPTSHDHMYEVAMKQGTCALTPLGKYYWNLVHSQRL